MADAAPGKNTRVTGSRFLRVDFHTHTPGSHDYRDAKATAADIISAAEAAGIDILAITDHNTVSWVDPVRAASKNRLIRVLPGVEITTPEGHILALFDLDYPSGQIADLLLRIGIPRERHGREEAISTEHVEVVLQNIAEAGGIAIAAHANSDSGVLKTKGQYKLNVLVPSPQLAALELGKQTDIERFCAGTVSADYRPKACTQSSDSHALKEIGQRVTYLKMDQVSLRGIRQALLDYEVKVRFPWNYKEPTHPAILALSVDQGFFGDQAFAFHDSLNCLVGGKGTGKSTVIELLRYCFDDVSTFENIHEDHEGKINGLVGAGGTIAVEFRDSDGEMKTIRREVQPWATERDVRDSAGNPAAVEHAPVFFSQGELVQIAASPIAQLDLLDRHLDLTRENQQEEALVEGLRTNAGHLISHRERLAALRTEIDHPETGKAASEAQYKKLEQQLKNPVLKELPSWEAEQVYIQALDESLQALPDQFTEALEAVDVEPLRAAPPPESPNKKQLRPLGDVPTRIEEALATLDKTFRKEVADLEGVVKRVVTSVTPLFLAKKAEHKRVLDTLGQADLRRATAQYRNLAKRLDQLRQSEAEVAQLARREAAAAKERNALRARLAACRQTRWRKRAAKAAEYEATLAGVVRVAVTEAGDRRSYAKALRELSRGGLLKEPDISHVVTTLDPPRLVEHILEGAVDRLAQDGGVTKEVAKRLVDSCATKDPRALYDLEVVPLPDEPAVRYVVTPGREKPLRELSTGQKGTVIIALAMAEGAGPLVIDQPEEPLDTQSIYSQVVRTLRRSKESRQFAFTTHNPNIAVGADADLSHILDAGADKGHVVSSGGVDNLETNRLLLVHLEGGRDALDLRVRKYAE